MSAARRRRAQRGLEGVHAALVGRDARARAWRATAARRRARRRRRRPLHHRRGRHRQEPPARRAARRLRAAAVDRRPTPRLARGPLRLVRRVAALLAVPRPPPRVARRRASTSRELRVRRRRCAAALERALRRPRRRALPVPRRAARPHARAATPRPASPSSRRRRSSTARSRSSRTLVAAAGRGRPGRRRARGPALGRPDVAPARRAAARRCTEDAAVLLVLTQRHERDHPSWALRELAARELPAPHARARARAAVRRRASASCSPRWSAPARCPPELERRLLDQAEGNPFFLEELVRSLVDAGALVRDDGGWRFDHDVAGRGAADGREGDPRALDRLAPECRDGVPTAASVLGRRFGAAAARGRRRAQRRAPWTRCTSCSGSTSCARHGAGRSPSTASSTR